MGAGAIWRSSRKSSATQPSNGTDVAFTGALPSTVPLQLPGGKLDDEELTQTYEDESQPGSPKRMVEVLIAPKKPVLQRSWSKEITEAPLAGPARQTSNEGRAPNRRSESKEVCPARQISCQSEGSKEGPARPDHRFDRIIQEQDDSRRSRSIDPSEVVEMMPLDDESRDFLSMIMAHHFLFNGMKEKDYVSVFAFMKKIPTLNGQVIFNQGERGDSCYFIRSGTFSVCIDGKQVKEMHSNQTFGELALIYSMARSATITCTSEGLLWKMERTQFARCMEHLFQQNNGKAIQFFGSDANFSFLADEHQKLLASNCTVMRFRDGDEILREGEVGEWMFIVISGTVNNSKSGAAHSTISNPVIGSVGLIYGKSQTFGFRASGSVVCLAIGRSSLPLLAGPVEDVLRRSAIKTLLAAAPGSAEKFRQSLACEQLHRLIGHFEEAIFEVGEVICEPGDPAQMLLIVEGEAAVLSHSPGSAETQGDQEQTLIDGMVHGEMELLSGANMTRHVVARRRTNTHRILYSQAQLAFGEPLSEAVRCDNVKKVLQDIFLFKNLKEDQIEHTVRRLQTRRYETNEVIVRQDDPAKHFFLIQQGTICVKKDDIVLRTLGCWDYFGERGLLLQERRSATCQALEPCICLVLDGDVFFEIVGMFRKELERRMYLQDLNITIQDLQCVAVVGRGTFGTVRLVHHRLDEKKTYALKAVKKLEVVKHAQQKSIVIEREVNKQCYHPCIMQFIKTFQDKEHVYFLTEFLGGGDLFYAIREIGFLSKLHSQFFSGSIALALEYLHARGIMYRDLKPENVLLDFNGTAKLVDFGCCKNAYRTHTLIGTPEYMAPEVIRQQGYTCACDWWSLGVMLHEFVIGPLPFGGDCEDQMSLFKAICDDPLVFPSGLEEDVMDVISGMLERKVERRLGSSIRGAKDIKAHSYYKGFNWDALGGGFHEPPFTPDTEALRKNWEPSDGDLTNNVGTTSFKISKRMEWSKDF